MPKMSEEQRQRWQNYQRHSDKVWANLEAKYHTKHKRHVECRLCGEMITVIEPADAFEALEAHEKTHPEYDEWIALGKEYPITELSDVLHDHDCIFVKCACQCGCQSDICVADLPPEKRNEPMLCSLCELYQGRGHVEHRLKDDYYSQHQ